MVFLDSLSFQQCGKEGRRLQTPAEVDETLKHATSTNKLLYFGNRLCPYAHVAWWCLLEKQLAIDYVHVDLGAKKKPQWYQKKINPYGTVPALLDGGKFIFESSIIAEYLEEKYPERGTHLLPKDPADRAAVRLIIAHFRERTLPPLYRLLKAQTPAEAKLAKEQILVEMLAFETMYNKHTPVFHPESSPFFLGKTFSLAEVCVFPFLERMCIALQHYRQLNPLQDAHLPRLQAAFEAVHDRPAWRASAQTPAFYVAVYEQFANPAPPCAAGTVCDDDEEGYVKVEDRVRRVGWKIASWMSVCGAAVPVVGVLGFGSFLLGVAVGWSHGRGWGGGGRGVGVGKYV